MIVFPNVKINIGLLVLNKRADGFHNIQSVFYPVPWYESLEIVKANEKREDKFKLKTYGFEIPGDPNDNLILKTLRSLDAEFSLPALDVHLIKKLPMGAGLGGGSADAAFALKAAVEVAELDIEDDKAEEILAGIGSDCPFFWRNSPQLVEGRGELMRSIDLDLSGMYILIVNPGIHVSTREAYANVKLNSNPPIDLAHMSGLPIEEWKGIISNGFEDGIVAMHPKIGEIKNRVYEMGAVYASMTGSGSSVYGLFREQPEVPKDWQQLDHFCGKL